MMEAMASRIQIAARCFIESHFLDNFPEKLLNARESGGSALHLLAAFTRPFALQCTCSYPR
jgi:hypothetical protein